MANLTFIKYEVTDEGVDLTFLDANPAASGRTASYYMVAVTDAEVAAATTQAALRTLVIAKLRRKLQSENIGVRLDPFIGQTVTI